MGGDGHDKHLWPRDLFSFFFYSFFSLLAIPGRQEKKKREKAAARAAARVFQIRNKGKMGEIGGGGASAQCDGGFGNTILSASC